MSKRWYVIHAYSGFEGQVKRSLEDRVKRAGLEELFGLILVPTEDVVEIRRGRKINAERKYFPGYVLVKMIITSESWYVVRNTRGVTGFVGPESKPVPLTDAEFEVMMNSQPQAEATKLVVGEEIRILSGPLENFTGIVEAVDVVHSKLQVKVKMFLGREMQVEIDLDHAEKI